MPTQASALRQAWFASLLALCAGVAQAAEIRLNLQGTMGNKALIVINAGRPLTLGPGQSAQGVRVLSVTGDKAVVEVDGQSRELRVGEAPGNFSGPSVGSSQDNLVLSADSRGHFFAAGSITNHPVNFLVDTGASAVAMGVEQAQSLGLNYRAGKPITVSTANGTAAGYLVKLDQVRIDGVVVYGVDAVVTPAPIPSVLLGNSFLNHFTMVRNGDSMSLQRR